MPRYRYLIVGAGMAGAAAIRGIRAVDPRGEIGVVGAETDRPYKRPPLTKGLWKGDSIDKIWSDVDRSGVTFHLDRQVRSLDLAEKRATDDRGETYGFERCLLATGGTPKRLPLRSDRIIYYRTLEHYRRLRALADTRQRFAVIGGGFIGSEIAAALAMNGKEVTLVVRGAGIGDGLYPPDLVRFLGDYYRQRDVTLLAGAQATGVEEAGGSLNLSVATRDGANRRVPVDGIVAGIGIEPNVALARAAGLDVDDGVVVTPQLQTSHPDVYAAGDVARFYNPALDRRLRVEHEDNANMMGDCAGRGMAGKRTSYDHLPFFYSDLFDLGYEAVGELDAGHEIVADWKEPNREGVVYYLRDGRVRGVLLWNVWGQVDAARRLIAAPGPFRPADLKGRLPESG
jgi:3-phenylpropionate/trans-cinnamate dioxygenase ferredoxin reductase component